MPAGSLLGAAGLAALSVADHPVTYLAVWALLGVAMASSLYDPAFASLGRIFGSEARRPITLLTLFAGLASTISWPTTSALIDWVGWRETYLIYAALLAFVAAPLHAFALPRSQAAHRCPGGRGGGAGFGATRIRHEIRPPGGGIRLLRVRSIGLVGSPAGDVRTLRHRSHNCGRDRHPVRPIPSGGAALRIYLRARRSPDRHRAVCGRGFACRICVVGLVWDFCGGRRGVHDFARPGERIDDDRARHRSSRAVRRLQLWPVDRPHRRPVADRAIVGAADPRIRGRAFIRRDGARSRGDNGHDLARLLSRNPSAAARRERTCFLLQDR